jgi:hypothetical protein
MITSIKSHFHKINLDAWRDFLVCEMGERMRNVEWHARFGLASDLLEWNRQGSECGCNLYFPL